jgi:hypothetical protein
MTKKGFVQIASRALALNMVMWSVAELALVPARVFSVAHYLNFQGRSPSQEYFLRDEIIWLLSHVVLSAAIFIASVWVYRCGPSVEAFLSPSEE